MINVPQTPLEEPVTIMKIELYEPGAQSIECKPILGANRDRFVIFLYCFGYGRINFSENYDSF